MDTATTTAAEATPTSEEPQDEYAIVEIFGHRRHAGRIQEIERFGAKMLRIDVPNEGDFAKGYVTQYYAGGSIFSLTPTDIDTVQRINRPHQPAGFLRAPEGSGDGEFDEEQD